MASREFRSAALGALLAFATVLATSRVAADPPSAVLDRVAQSVFRLKCNNQSGSAFAWRDSETLVTSYHVVAACRNNVEVYSAWKNQTRNASIERVLKERDLALIKLIQQNPRWDLTPLPIVTTDPAVGEAVTVMGHPLGIPTVRATKVVRQWGARRIRDLVPPQVFSELDNLGWPDLGTNVHPYGEGHIAPAHSGAPIIDDQGRVVSIAHGGLKNGAVEIAWGMPAGNLDALRNASTSWTSDAAPRVTELFADKAIPEARANAAIRCGSTALTWIRRQNLRDLAKSTDDASGLQQLVNTLTNGGTLFDAYTLDFDIYRDLDSGGTVVVPAALPIQSNPNGDQCSATDPAWGLTLSIQVDRVQDMIQAEQVAMNFEARALSGYQGFLDPAFSYLSPIQRPDGLLVNRKSLILHSPMAMGPNLPPQMRPTAYFFETLATRSSGALAVAVVKTAIDFDMMCINGGARGDPRCNNVWPRHRRYAHMTLGVHLSTFPLG